MSLEIINVDVCYGDLQVLWDVSLKIEEKQIVSIVGANGAGKTTLIKTVSGLLTPTSGRINFSGQRIDTLPAYEVVDLGIVQIPEGRRVFPYMDVLENLEMGAYTPRARKMKKETLEVVFGLFPTLKNKMTQRAGTLSGGEQQMLAIARGMMARPKLLMLDEPSLGLAPKLVKQVFQVVEQINNEGITVLLVEQNVSHSLAIADRGYVLENGRIVLEGKGEDLLDNRHVKKAYLGI